MTNFEGYNIFVKNMRDGGHRVEIDVSDDQYDNIKDLPKLVKGIYKFTIEPVIEPE